MALLAGFEVSTFDGAAGGTRPGHVGLSGHPGHRHADAGDGRDGVLARAGHRSGAAGHPRDRARRCADGGRGDAARGLRLHREALRAGALARRDAAGPARSASSSCENRASAAATSSDAQRVVGRIIGTSPLRDTACARCADFGRRDVNVVVNGETGAGKEVVARLPPRLRPAGGTPLRRRQLRGHPRTIVESELFGHRGGRLHGRAEARSGGSKTANGGTVFLDEIEACRSPPRANSCGRCRNVAMERLGSKSRGARRPASDRGEQDRLAPRGPRPDSSGPTSITGSRVAELRIPSLRERREDIPLLFEYFARRGQGSWAGGAPVSGCHARTAHGSRLARQCPRTAQCRRAPRLRPRSAGRASESRWRPDPSPWRRGWRPTNGT